MKRDGSTQNFRVTKLFGYFGLKRNEIKEAKAGDIIAISGINDIYVGETIASAEHPEALPLLKIDPPTLQMDFVAKRSIDQLVQPSKKHRYEFDESNDLQAS